MISVAIIDDHKLFSKSLVLMLQTFGQYEVVIEAANGKDFQKKVQDLQVYPDIILLDVSMPVMNGAETARWIRTNYPLSKIVALSMNNYELTIIDMLKAGCCGYLLKDTHPDDLEIALNTIVKKGYYNGDKVNKNVNKLVKEIEDNKLLQLSEREKIFLQFACSDMTYKEIALKMEVTERTIDGYRESLFEKFNVQSRVGLCLEAIRRGIIVL